MSPRIRYRENDSLYLSSYQPEDERLLYEVWQDKVTKEGFNFESQESFDEFCRSPIRFLFTVVRQDDEAILGFVFLSPEGSPPDLAIIMRPEYRGQGYGSRAYQLALDYCFDQLNLHKVYAGCYEDNQVSQTMLSRLGFVRHPRGDGLDMHYRTGEGRWQRDYVKYRPDLLELRDSLHQVEQRLDRLDFAAMWPNFKRTNYALYNQTYLVMPHEIDGLELEPFFDLYLGVADGRFLGNTAFEIEGQTIAIWQLESEDDPDWDGLTASIVHEMFHGLQINYGESRFANEMIGYLYPMTVDNFGRRFKERSYLLKAVQAEEETECREALEKFYGIRLQRAKLIKESMAYEQAIETIEGVATYIEYLALRQLRPDESLETFLEDYEKVSLVNLKVRQSSYAQGMLLCLLADRTGEWKLDFQTSSLLLSEFVQQRFNLDSPSLIDDIDVFHVQPLIAEWQRNQERIFLEFEDKKLGKVIEQDLKMVAFDPMNLVGIGNEIIHLNFLRVKVAGEQQVISGPVKATIGDSLWDLKRIEW